LELATLALILGLAIAIPVGVLSATRQDKPADYVGRVVAVSGLSFPDFWLGTLVITFAAIWFRWIPPLGYVSIWDDPWRNLQQFLGADHPVAQTNVMLVAGVLVTLSPRVDLTHAVLDPRIRDRGARPRALKLVG